MTATRTFPLVTLLLGALATAAILLVIDPVGSAMASDPGITATADDPGATDHHGLHQHADDRDSTEDRADGFRDFGGIGTLDGTTEGTLARLRQMGPERLAGLHRHDSDDSGDDHHGDHGGAGHHDH